jgi:hypothetical protein
MSGFSIKTGWGDEKKIVERYPGPVAPLDLSHWQAWLDDAEERCEQHNAALAGKEKDEQLHTRSSRT